MCVSSQTAANWKTRLLFEELIAHLCHQEELERKQEALLRFTTPLTDDRKEGRKMERKEKVYEEEEQVLFDDFLSGPAFNERQSKSVREQLLCITGHFWRRKGGERCWSVPPLKPPPLLLLPANTSFLWFLLVFIHSKHIQLITIFILWSNT